MREGGKEGVRFQKKRPSTDEQHRHHRVDDSTTNHHHLIIISYLCTSFIQKATEGKLTESTPPVFEQQNNQPNTHKNAQNQEEQEGVHDFRDHIDPDNHGPKVVEYEPEDKPRYDRPYLILDVRPSEEFKKSRIVQVGGGRGGGGRTLDNYRVAEALEYFSGVRGQAYRWRSRSH